MVLAAKTIYDVYVAGIVMSGIVVVCCAFLFVLHKSGGFSDVEKKEEKKGSFVENSDI